MEFISEGIVNFTPADFDEVQPPYLVECPACGEGPFYSLAEEKDHARRYHTKPVTKFREYMDDDMGFFETLEDDADPAEYVPAMAEEFGEVVDPYLQEAELLRLPHTDCTSYFCDFHGKRNVMTDGIDTAMDSSEADNL